MKYIIGIDECGTGSLVGDVYACAFIAPENWSINGLNDSKKISEKQREHICDNLIELSNKESDIGFSIVFAHPNNIDEYSTYGSNLHSLLKFLYWNAVNNLKKQYVNFDTKIILDGNIKFPNIPYSLGESESLIKADSKIPHVMAASIIGKVHRDNYMKQLDQKYPQYNWGKNKGYLTADHKELINKYGVCLEHRVSYEPIKSMILEKLKHNL